LSALGRYNDNKEAKEKCSFLFPSMTLLQTSLGAIKEAREKKALEDRPLLQSLDAAVYALLITSVLF
jgi:hypothetical protein